MTEPTKAGNALVRDMGVTGERRQRLVPYIDRIEAQAREQGAAAERGRFQQKADEMRVKFRMTDAEWGAVCALLYVSLDPVSDEAMEGYRRYARERGHIGPGDARPDCDDSVV